MLVILSNFSYMPDLPVGTIICGDLCVIIGGGFGGIGTTLILGACKIGGMGAVNTEPGGRRTTEPIGGLCITGTADTIVVRIGGGI